MMRVFLNINVDQSSPRGKTWPLQQPSTVDHLAEQVLVFEKDSISQKLHSSDDKESPVFNTNGEILKDHQHQW